MELKEGMYVRTDNGIIGKIYEKIGDMFTYKDSNRNYITYGSLHSEIVKSSHSLLGNDTEPCLIEVGDYVNGNKVININGTLYVNNEGALEDIVIKSIVTKEQFESMSYKVGE